MKKIHFTLSLLTALTAFGGISAQETAAVTQVTMPGDTVATLQPAPMTAIQADTLYYTPGSAPVAGAENAGTDYGAILGLDNYDQIPDDALLPITREQAEEAIAAMIVAARAPGQEAINRAEILNDFKVEMLRRRLLEEALRKSYTDEYERRLDKLENFILLLLANNGLDPNAVTNLISGLTGNGQPGSTVVLPGQNGAVPANGLVPGSSDGTSPVALAPGAKAASWEHFLSQVFYAFDSSKLNADAKKVLDDVAGWIRETGMGVTLRGWASPEGKMSYNNALSGRRVQAAADYLKSKGISEKLLKVIPSGIDSMKDTKGKYPAGRRVDIRPDYGEKAI